MEYKIIIDYVFLVLKEREKGKKKLLVNLLKVYEEILIIIFLY